MFRERPGEVSVSAYARGYDSGRGGGYVTVAEGNTVEKQFVLAPKPWIKGQALDPNGKPCQRRPRASEHAVRAKRRFSLTTPTPMVNSPCPWCPFESDPNKDIRVELRIRDAVHDLAAATTLENPQTKFTQATLTPASTLKGQVSDEDGKPIPERASQGLLGGGRCESVCSPIRGAGRLHGHTRQLSDQGAAAGQVGCSGDGKGVWLRPGGTWNSGSERCRRRRE